MEQRKNPVMIYENRLIIGMFTKNVEQNFGKEKMY